MISEPKNVDENVILNCPVIGTGSLNSFVDYKEKLNTFEVLFKKETLTQTVFQ